VNRQPKSRPNSSYERITELESRLDRANRYVRRLRQDNNELKRRLSWLENKHRQPSTLLEKEVVIPDLKPRRRRRRRSPSYGEPVRIDSAKNFSLRKRKFKRVRLRLVAAIALAAGSILAVTMMVRQLLSPASETAPSPEAAAAVTAAEPLPLPPSPLTPPEYPRAQAASLPSLSADLSSDNIAPVYNLTTAPNLKPSKDLQAIVDELVDMAAKKGRPTEALSITLIDVNSGEVAGYQQTELRFPASVLKMFWMVYLYGTLAQGILPDEAAFTPDLYRMVQQSSNDAASRIIDTVTGTSSGGDLSGENYENWRRRRLFLTEFFRKSLSTLDRPKGREGQMWDDPQQPIRNKISSEHAARLMYEIVRGEAISPEYSQKMLQWLARDLTPAGKEDTQRFGGFNPIAGFFGQSLPADIDFASKAGWSSGGRHEVAFVKTRDGKSAYILSILAGDREYSNDWGLFPEMSRYVFERLAPRD
jgi:Beta-lactamase enzyme family